VQPDGGLTDLQLRALHHASEVDQASLDRFGAVGHRAAALADPLPFLAVDFESVNYEVILISYLGYQLDLLGSPGTNGPLVKPSPDFAHPRLSTPLRLDDKVPNGFVAQLPRVQLQSADQSHPILDW